MSEVPYFVVGFGLIPVFAAITTFVHEWGHARVLERYTGAVAITVGAKPYVHVPRPVMRLIGLKLTTARVGPSVGGHGCCAHGSLPPATTYPQVLRLCRAGYRATFLLVTVSVVPGIFVLNVLLDAVGADGSLTNFAHILWAVFVYIALASTVVDSIWQRPPSDGRPSTDAWKIRQLKRIRGDGEKFEVIWQDSPGPRGLRGSADGPAPSP